MKILLKPENELYKKEIEVVGLVSLVETIEERNRETGFGMTFYEFLKDGRTIYFKTTKEKCAMGFTPRILDNLLNEYALNGNVHGFRFTDDGDFFITKEKLKENRIKNKSRRYIILKIENKFYITDCTRLNILTKHYKKNEKRNQKGLQWGNLCSKIKYIEYKH